MNKLVKDALDEVNTHSEHEFKKLIKDKIQAIVTAQKQIQDLMVKLAGFKKELKEMELTVILPEVLE